MTTNCQSAETWEWQFYHGFLDSWIITIICFLHTASRISVSHATRFLHSFRGALLSAQPCTCQHVRQLCFLSCLPACTDSIQNAVIQENRQTVTSVHNIVHVQFWFSWGSLFLHMYAYIVLACRHVHMCVCMWRGQVDNGCVLHSSINASHFCRFGLSI